MPACAAFGVKSSTSVTGRVGRAPLLPPSPLPPHPAASRGRSSAGRKRRSIRETTLCEQGAGRLPVLLFIEGGALEASEANEPVDENRTLGDDLAEDAAATTVAEIIPARGPAAYVAEFIGTFTLVL